jgi:hypothetical protein
MRTAPAVPRAAPPTAQAMLLARIYDALPLLCTRCGAPMKIVAFVTDRESVRRILEHLREPSSPPPLVPARGPPQDEPHQDPLADLAFDQTLDLSDDAWA